MYKTPSKITNWVWRWHIIGGLVTLPIVLLLCVTGTIYLFKDKVNHTVYADTFVVQKAGKQPMSLEEQLANAQAETSKDIASVTLPQSDTDTTVFRLKTPGHARNQLHINPYTGDVAGQFVQTDTWMYTIRKLHGELLLGKAGTLVVETVASWFIVLLVTGLYLWWPTKAKNAGVVTIRVRAGKRTFWRDVHAVGGFWLSLAMLTIIAGGMPWTDVFGSNLKWVQAQTDTGFPPYWRNAKGLSSTLPNTSSVPINLDQIVQMEKVRALKGAITITLPQGERGVYSVRNRSFWLDDQEVVHIDQYSGETIKHLHYQEVGVLMDLRLVFMRLHQGEYGLSNWLIVLVVTVLFTLTTVASLVSYLYRKPKHHWGLPRTPNNFRVDALLLLLILALGMLFPMFGLTVVIIVSVSVTASYLKRIRASG